MNKLDSLVNERVYNKQLRPRLNLQTDSTRAKVFVKLFFAYANLEDFFDIIQKY